MDINPQGKARRKSSSNFDPKLNILSELKAEVSNTSAFRRGEGSGRAGGGIRGSLDPPVCLEEEEGWEVRLF